ncbi:hypothetical protein AB0C13_26920 [Streptomyces sp. NPDC049099]|uniref:hypothetical protein n=1 Tax=Streptomyces sp. NPDC049099 TaxID=3155768 RepID=UPI00341E4F46
MATARTVAKRSSTKSSGRRCGGDCRPLARVRPFARIASVYGVPADRLCSRISRNISKNATHPDDLSHGAGTASDTPPGLSDRP